MADRLYGQLERDGFVLAGVADTLSDADRKVKRFKDFEIRPLGDYGDMIREGAYVILAVNACLSVGVIRTYLEEYRFLEESLLVPNPYTTLRPFVMNDEFAAEQRIPVSDARYIEVGELFQDDLSKLIYRRILNSGQYDHERDAYELTAYSQIKDMYWWSEDYWQTYPFKGDQAGEWATVIDCGAYIGDSIVQICGSIPEKNVRYYAFEPDADNACIIRSQPEFMNVCSEMHVMEYGVGNRNHRMCFELPDNKEKYGGRFVNDPAAEADSVLEVRRMDDLQLDLAGTVYLKMDIEGFELPALEGAHDLIQKYRPYMAICVYHRKNDLIHIPLYIKNLVPDYQFYLRGGFHTILWAVPVEKA